MDADAESVSPEPSGHERLSQRVMRFDAVINYLVSGTMSPAGTT